MKKSPPGVVKIMSSPTGNTAHRLNLVKFDEIMTITTFWTTTDSYFVTIHSTRSKCRDKKYVDFYVYDKLAMSLMGHHFNKLLKNILVTLRISWNKRFYSQGRDSPILKLLVLVLEWQFYNEKLSESQHRHLNHRHIQITGIFELRTFNSFKITFIYKMGLG